MQINDLSYLENTYENELILGGASAFIGANAYSEGINSLTLTNTDLKQKDKKNGASHLKGIGLALAIGEQPTAEVYYGLDGYDKVKAKTFSQQGQNYDLEILRLKAIDLPNK